PGGAPFVVTTTSPMGAELPPGSFYYLGVRNVDQTEVNDFAIQTDFNIRIVPLPDGKPLLNRMIGPNPYSFMDIRRNTPLAVTNMDYYYFDIGSTDIVSLTFNVFPFMNSDVPFNGDVNMVLRR